MITPAASPALDTLRTQQLAELYPRVDYPIDRPDQGLYEFPSLCWTGSGALPDPSNPAAQPTSPIRSYTGEFQIDTLAASSTATNYASTISVLSSDHIQASLAKATNSVIAADADAAATGVVFPTRDRRVARQAFAPSTFTLGDSPSDPSFGQHHHHHHHRDQHNHHNSGPLPSSSGNLSPRPASQENAQFSPVSKHNIRDRQNRRRRFRLHQDPSLICNPRHCCLHHQPPLSPLESHPLSVDLSAAAPVSAITAVPVMDNDDPHDIAAQQAAAKDYQPAHDSPLIGTELPVENITIEYAKADPIYIEKTLALPQTYSEYRPVRGDGNCGWRAIGFSYFEKLAEYGDGAKIKGELERLTAYNNLLESVGEYNYWEDFAEPAMELLTDLAAQANNAQACQALVFDRWNDANATNAIIYYFRLLAATYLKEHAADYDPFVPSGQGVRGHCEAVIQPVNREIEHLGIIALSNLLLKPIGAILEIAYLDRSEGSTVNQYRFPEEANEQDAAALGPVIYLLYRPEHYDILYRGPAPNSPTQVAEGMVYHVNRAEILPTDLDVDSTPAIGGVGGFPEMDFGLLSTIMPNYFEVPRGGSIGSSGTADAIPDSYVPQQGTWAPQYEESMSATSSSMVPTSTTGLSTNPSTPLTAESSSMATGVTQPVTGSAGSATDCQIRFSNAQYEYDGIPEQFQVQTSTFKNSVYNTAHFRNPNFQPEECRPDGEPSEKRLGAKKKKRQDL